MDPNYTLNDELTIIRSKLQDSAFAPDYPDVDDYIPYRPHQYYIDENPEDYIRRIDTYNNYIENQDVFAGQDGEPEKYRVNLNKEQYKKLAESTKEENVYKQSTTIKSITFMKVINSLIFFCSNLLKPIPDEFKENKTEYYYILLTNDYTPLSIIILLLVMMLFVIIING
jgi:hypothetical protein